MILTDGNLIKRERCLKVASELVAKGSSVAVGELRHAGAPGLYDFGILDRFLTTPDNTNADPDTRIHWVKLAQRFNIPIRCVLFTASSKLGEHNDAVRALNGALVSIPSASHLDETDNARMHGSLEGVQTNYLRPCR